MRPPGLTGVEQSRVLSILSVAYPLASVEPDAVGGAEQVVSALDAALVAAGHRSTVLACAGSRVRGTLAPVPLPTGPLHGAAIAAVQGQVQSALQQLLAEQTFDVVHFHGCDCAAYLRPAPRSRAPARLVTLHVPCEWYNEQLFRLQDELSFVCVSAWQQQRAAAHGVTARATIENGVDLQRWQPLPAGEKALGCYAACIGRICPEKGFDRALRAAHQADTALLLAGQVFGYPEHERHFEREIRPLLDHRRRFLGPIGGASKRRLLAGAAWLVVPSRVAETSSLVTMEALACGTPVIVSSPGAPASLIEPGRTGVLALSASELTRALRRTAGLDRSACRRSAERRFDVQRTAAAYLELYHTLASERAPRAHVPVPRRI